MASFNDFAHKDFTSNIEGDIDRRLLALNYDETMEIFFLEINSVLAISRKQAIGKQKRVFINLPFDRACKMAETVN